MQEAGWFKAWIAASSSFALRFRAQRGLPGRLLPTRGAGDLQGRRNLCDQSSGAASAWLRAEPPVRRRCGGAWAASHTGSGRLEPAGRGARRRARGEPGQLSPGAPKLAEQRS